LSSYAGNLSVIPVGAFAMRFDYDITYAVYDENSTFFSFPAKPHRQLQSVSPWGFQTGLHATRCLPAKGQTKLFIA